MPKKRVICDSGEHGLEQKLREIYDNYTEFLHFNKMYNITERVGYVSPRKLWDDNPVIQGSSNPKDLKIVEPQKQ